MTEDQIKANDEAVWLCSLAGYKGVPYIKDVVRDFNQKYDFRKAILLDAMFNLNNDESVNALEIDWNNGVTAFIAGMAYPNGKVFENPKPLQALEDALIWIKDNS